LREVAVAEVTLDQALPAVQDLADRKANAFVRRCGFPTNDREDVRSQLLLSFLLRWPKFDAGRASVRTFASRVMDKELTSILRHNLALSRREQDLPQPAPTLSAAARAQFRIDVEQALETLPAAIQETALALFWCSTVEAAEELQCSRQIIHLRKRRIRHALVSAGIGPGYFQRGGAR
jgi:DNA-directed RNA polymerase specialized sigma24 family protein